VAAVVLLVGLVSMERSSGATGYRTSTAAVRSVDETLHRVGTIEPVSQADVGFPVDGTVASVAVAVGDSVAVGQALASLDTTSLEATLVEKQAALDNAELTLEKALAGEDVSSGGNTGSGGLSITPAAYTTDPELTAAQQAVLDGQKAVDAQLAVAQQALDDAGTICEAVGLDESTALETEQQSTTTTTLTDESSAAVAACRTALEAVLSAQSSVSVAQHDLAAASSALDALLDERAAELDAAETEESADASRDPSGSSGTDAPPTGSGGTGAGGTTSSSPTAAELIAFQAAVDAAGAEVVVAKQALSQATIVSPIAGSVAAVGLDAGDSVTAGSTDTGIVVVGEGGFELSTTVTVAALQDLAIGQPATVTPDGSETALDGEVVSVGVAGTPSGTSTTYPVVVSLADNDTGDGGDLRNGATASVAIVTDEAGDALTVPTSSVHFEGGISTVAVLEDGTPSDVEVQVGAVGPEWAEIADGLDAGDVVVLADLDEPLPGSATDGSSSSAGTFTRGGFRP
jgi:HlyD family secretion protein